MVTNLFGYRRRMFGGLRLRYRAQVIPANASTTRGDCKRHQPRRLATTLPCHGDNRDRKEQKLERREQSRDDVGRCSHLPE